MKSIHNCNLSASELSSCNRRESGRLYYLIYVLLSHPIDYVDQDLEDKDAYQDGHGRWYPGWEVGTKCR